jgi:hypothetical protein
MCTPLAYAALAAQGASTLLNARANSRIMDRQRELSGAERARQAAFREEAEGTLNETMGRFERDTQEGNIDRAAQRREGAISDVVSAPSGVGPGDLPGSGDAPEVVRSTIARRMADAISRGRDEIKARARLGAFGENSFGNRIALGRSGQDINRMASFSRGSASVLPHELAGAHREGASMQRLADLFRLGGTGLGLYSMMGMPAGPAQSFTMQSPGGLNLHVPGVP